MNVLFYDVSNSGNTAKLAIIYLTILKNWDPILSSGLTSIIYRAEYAHFHLEIE